MNFLNIDEVPSWAKQWCYIFATLGFVVLITAILALLQAPKLGFAFAMFFFTVSLIQTATYFTLFWMCRSSLRNA